MKLLIYEHITSGALCNEPLPEDLAGEGDAMLRALLNDLAGNLGVKPVILRDSRLRIPANIHRCHYIRDLDEFCRRWFACLDYVDAVLPIAPESDGLLAEIQDRVLRAGKRLLGCNPETTRIAASKILTHKYLTAAGLATAPTVWLKDWQSGTFKEGPLICKPGDGAGCHQVLYFENAAALNTWKQQSLQYAWENLIVQPYLQGIAASLCLLCADAEARLLSRNHQLIQIKEGALQLTGITVNALKDPEVDYSVLQAIADTIARTLPGLWGFVGVDLVFSQGQPIVLEINPRLTTSYIGLRKAFGENPATWLLVLLNRGLAAVELPLQPGQEVTLSLGKNVAIQTLYC